MNKIVSVLCVLVALGIAGWLATMESEEPAVALPQPSSTTTEREVRALDFPSETLSAERSEAGGATADLVSHAAANPKGCHVFGRVLSTDGLALGGVEVFLSANDGPWAEGVEAPPLSPTRWSTRTGFSTRTLADGSFRFDVPRPTARIRFEAQTGAYFDRLDFIFGGNYTESRAPLRGGDNDLGDLLIGHTGAISGHVRDSHGQAIHDARIIVEYPSASHSGQAYSQSDGSFRVEHVPAGRLTIQVLADGFLKQGRDGIDVRVGQDTGGVDFELEGAPSISGRAEDQYGEPVVGAHITAWPLGSGWASEARTRSDGSFQVMLLQNEAHRFEVRLSGYEHRMPPLDAPVYQVGETDVKLLVRKLGQTTFVVLDDETGHPIERYGLAVGLVYEPRVQINAEGRVTRWVEPAESAKKPNQQRLRDPGFSLYAPGYARLAGSVLHDADCDPNAPVQTLRLRRGGSLTGTVFSDGQPSGFPVVSIERGKHKLDPNSVDLDQRGQQYSKTYGFSVGAFEGTKRVHQGESDGRFKIDDLNPGTYTIAIQPAQGATFERKLVQVEEGKVCELGNLEATRGAAVHGTIVVADGKSPSAILVEIECSDYQKRRLQRSQETLSDHNGLFEFSGLMPGEYTLNVQAKPGVLAPGEPVTIKLSEGETQEVRLDLSKRNPCRVAIRVSFDGRPAAGVRARAVHLRGNKTWELGVTDATGLLVAEKETRGKCNIQLFSPAGLELWQSEEFSRFRTGGEVELAVDLSPGELVLELSAKIREETDFTNLELTDAAGETQELSLIFHSGALLYTEAQWADGRLNLGPLRPDTYAVRWRLDQQGTYGAECVVLPSKTTESDLSAQ